ncbi:MAG TPA: uroporphyrinogen decarboxylase family protein [Thermodesulfobacteriota bacterium]|nr:uroporphyrinogen decarboxylase family protein [Thermodesulfobacteriota bacterium]
MNSRERVLAALDHKVPDRVPIDLGSFPGATSMNVRAYQNLLQYLGIKREVRIGALIMFTAEIDEDILDRFHVDTKTVTPSKPLSDYNYPERFVDRPWGVTWLRSTDYTYAPVEGPFQKLEAPTLEDLNRFTWPKPSDIEDFAAWREKGKRLRQESDKAIVARVVPGIYTLAQFMRGFESWMIDLMLHREFSDGLHERLAAIWIETVGRIVEALGENVDIIMFGDDFGLQNQTIVSPQMFRERLKPLMKKMVSSVKARTRAKVALHTCGSVFAYLDDFVDIGIDVLNPLQSNAKDMEAWKIKEKVGKRMALWGGIDTHGVLPGGNPDDVRKEVKNKIAILGKGGGYMLSADHNILTDVPPQNLITMFDAAVEFGKYGTT